MGGTATGSELSCKQGPITRSFAGSEWHVYACDDQRSVVVTIAKSTPRLPFFYFHVTPLANGVEVVGEGNGEKTLTEPVYKELSKLRPGDVASLVAEASRALSR